MGPYLTLRERHDRKLAGYHAAVEALKPALAEYGRAHGGRFILFGSAARGTPHDQSDVDIIVDFPEAGSTSACNFAEERCWASGLMPDVRPIAWTSDKLVARALEEGVVLGNAP
jgi:predicted nucleotidyltransferase